MERFLQSGWASIRVSTSLNTGLVDLKGRLGNDPLKEEQTP